MSRRAAFTLMEMSIVLVILGLLVGGVLVGRHLIQGSGYTAFIGSERQAVTAIGAFHDKYNALPGDMTNATSFWGSAGGAGNDAACQAAAASGTTTCNGDGNGQVALNSNSVYEQLRMWQHLANAGLFKGSYTGQAGTPTLNAANIPATKLNDILLYAAYDAGSMGSTSVFAYPAGNLFESLSPAGATPAMSPGAAYAIDAKADDGLPNTGRIIGYKGTATNPCSSKAGGTAGALADRGATYNVTDANLDCYVMFPSAF